MEKVIFDTNGYRDLVANKTDKQIEKTLQRLKDRESKLNIESVISPIVAKELLAHLADKSDPGFDKCLKANRALYFHSGSRKSYRMLASGKSGVIDHLIPDQTDHPKLSPKSDCFRGHFCGYKVG